MCIPVIFAVVCIALARAKDDMSEDPSCKDISQCESLSWLMKNRHDIMGIEPKDIVDIIV